VSDMSDLARTLIEEIRARPQQFSELVEAHPDVPWRTFLRAWGELRSAGVLSRDDYGRYLIGDDT
jgi:hypothetical protein